MKERGRAVFARACLHCLVYELGLIVVVLCAERRIDGLHRCFAVLLLTTNSLAAATRFSGAALQRHVRVVECACCLLLQGPQQRWGVCCGVVVVMMVV